jgi:molybdopterin-containing oxidoreductase family iron-sulfur binding subunit
MNNQEVWVGIEDLTRDEQFVKQATEEFPITLTDALKQENGGFETNRRDFLKYLGFGIGAATVAASCEIPVKRAIPYVTKPDTIVPGVANYYASSFVQGGDYCAVLVKTREGRPIKIEGNAMSDVTMGASSARAQASVLSLYDTHRIQAPASVKEGELTALKGGWTELDNLVKSKINAGGQIRIVANTIISPMTLNAIADFAAKYPNTKTVIYDPVSYAAILQANENVFGLASIPDYKFEEADIIVSFGADFLGTWGSPIENAARYAKKRKVTVENPKMSRHIQVENGMSMTGSNADNRILVKPSEQGAAIAFLASQLGIGVSVPSLNDKAKKALTKVAAELQAAKGKSIVISSSNDVNEQTLVNAINNALGNYDATIDFDNANLMRRGNDADVQNLISEMNSGAVSALFVLGANPVFELSNGAAFAAGMKKVGLSVSFNPTVDETTAACQYAAPANHYLESWGDANPKVGQYSLIQPTIAPLFNTRQAETSLLTWAGATVTDAHDYLKNLWQGAFFPRQREFSSFQTFWDATLHDGVISIADARAARGMNQAAIAQAIAGGVSQPQGNKDAIEINFYEAVNMGNGQYATNPWLQEMPDPVTRTVWGNVLQVPIEFDGVNNFVGFNDLKDGDKVEVAIGNQKYTCVVVRQFGQMKGTASIALGYGRSKAGMCSDYGTNVNTAIPLSKGLPQYYSVGTISGKVGHDDDFACVQHHHTMGVKAVGKEENAVINADEKSLGWKGFQGSLTDRTVIRQANLKDIKDLAHRIAEEKKEHDHLNAQTLYRGHQDRYMSGLHWAMHVDLNACIGCGACTVACMSENNVPVVGKHEVKRHHEMTWIRIDRYYYGDVENPNTVYQPMMCQHCDNAPCENVCPVNATNHSAEGLNQMTYNRCIGTRYCANNCPYKVRRFNWQDYTTADIFPWNERKLTGATLGFSSEMPWGADNLTRMVLNPDVTVRTRGVIEKCSFCVQRIQEGKLTAKKEARTLHDGDVKTACQTACPTGAITFGNRNDKSSEVSQVMKSALNYRVLNEVNTDSNVTYSAKVINKDEKLDA